MSQHIKYCQALEKLGIEPLEEAARLFEVHPRTTRRWMDGDVAIPYSVFLALRLMIENRELSRVNGSRR